ncbi:uroporphyrinogen-III C-methyltransferase [Vibrio lentus]|nr:uroporphyrinogen-III C-methyltransferase [Vibrio lentus]
MTTILLFPHYPLIDRDGLVLHRITSLQNKSILYRVVNAILPEAAVVREKAVSQDINDWQNNLMTSMKDFSENFITFRSRDGEVIPLLSPDSTSTYVKISKANQRQPFAQSYKEQGELYSAALYHR